jgi:F-type H+-transporting ATPase subunit b
VNNPLVQPDPGLFIWTIVTFLVLVWLLAKFAWRPLLAALEQRRKTIAGAVDDARKAKEDLATVQQQAAQVMTEARREADAVVTRTRADADRLREELRTKAAAEAATITKNAEQQIQRETARAISVIREEAVDLSLAVASKILGRTVTAADHQALIDDVIKEVGQSKSGSAGNIAH